MPVRRRLYPPELESILRGRYTKCHAAIFLAIFGFGSPAEAIPILIDKGIFLAGPFGVPDIHQPPSASDEAVFLSGSPKTAPHYLNEFVLNSDGSAGQFSDNGWVNGSAFSVNIVQQGASLTLWWDMSNTRFTVGYLSINFDNNFYHVYQIDDAATLSLRVPVTGNARDKISHIRFFGDRVPEPGSSALFLAVGLAAIALARRLLS